MLYTGETWVDLNKAPEVARVVGAAQGYKTATTAKLEVFKGPMTLSSEWSGGSREDYTLVEIATGRTLPLPRDTWGKPAPTLEDLPAGFALVECSMFRGKRMPATVYVNADTLNRLALPERPTLTEDQITVLRITRSVKGGSYRINELSRAFIKQHANPLAHAALIKEQLAALGLLTAQGGITPAGRNAISDKPSWM